MSANKKFIPKEATYDPALDAYDNVVLFPKKVAQATEHFKKYALPHLKKQTKKSKKLPLSPLQTELLSIYTFEPTENQMQQLKEFLQQLFSEQLSKSQTKQEAKMVA